MSLGRVRGGFLGFSTADLGPEGLKVEVGGGGSAVEVVALGFGLRLELEAGEVKGQSRDQ